MAKADHTQETKSTDEHISTKDQSKPEISDTKGKDSAGQKEQDLYVEDSLALAGLSFRQKTAYKHNLYKKRIADMNTKEKISYTVFYYKWHFVFFVSLFIIIGWGIRTAYRTTLPTVLSVAILNDPYNHTAADYIPDAFRQYYQLDQKNFFKVYTDLFVSSTEDKEEFGQTMTDYQKIGYYNMYDMLDAIIGDEEALTLYATSDDTTGIDLSMDDSLYQQIKDRVITMSDPNGIKNDGKPYAAAIDISDTEFVKNCGISYDKVYLMIPSTKYTNNQGTIDLIRFIFSL
ncbi:MAG: hypothetical protein NC124_00920 [Clostridium sp.]|nr:hypothetical protein [Clostridium sp.]